KAGDLVKVKVMDVDIPRKRIALSMRLTDDANASRSERSKSSRTEKRQHTPSAKKRPSQAPRGAMAAAFAKLGKV
ncbi:MAG: hypothetical protein JAY60_19870, partial [Candidatus Thiodiazotropha weberae]|nr:hypothetical protein [Candidatus Thiodiazotropha weberae]